MPAAKFLVCERTGDWAVAWRRALPGVRVQETRSLAEARNSVLAHPASVLAVAEEMAPAEQLAAWLAEMHAQFPRARLLLLASPAGSDLEWFAREAGAVQVLRSRMEIPSAVTWIAAHLAQFAVEAGSLRERTLARLPWPRQATGELKLEPEPESET